MKKFILNILLLIGIACLGVLVAWFVKNCGGQEAGPGPEETVRSFYSSLLQGDWEGAGDLCAGTDDMKSYCLNFRKFWENAHKTDSSALAAASGIDSLTHALEAYVSLYATPFTQGIAQEACKMVFANLSKSVNDGKNNPHRKMRMIKVIPVAVALSIAQPLPKVSKHDEDILDIKNPKLEINPNFNHNFIMQEDGTYVRTLNRQQVHDISQRFAKLLEKFKKEQMAKMGTYGTVTTNLDVSKTRYLGRAEVFNKYFEGGVLEGKGAKLIELQDKYGINALFLAAITLVESGGGKSKAAREKYNVAGIRIRENGKYVIKRFKNVDECLESLAANLSKNYIKEDLKTIEKINGKYAESQVWAEHIVYHINKIMHDPKV